MSTSASEKPRSETKNLRIAAEIYSELEDQRTPLKNKIPA